jgi:gluconolactonase
VHPEIPIDRFEVYASGLDHPECVALDREGELWAGGEAGQIYRIDRQRQVHTIATLGGFSGGIAFSPADELIVCNPKFGLVRVDRAGKHELFADHAGDHKLFCPNFPAFDSRGNLFVSDSGKWLAENGCLCRFTPDGVGKVIYGPMGYANGLALSADERFLFMVESNTNSVLRLELSREGDVVGHETYATECGWTPDGLALDLAGNLYVSAYASDDIYRIGPDRARMLFAFDPRAILLSRPTNMAFDGQWMYVANLGRTTVSRVKLDVTGLDLVNRR